jgi:hypothetical protein
MFHHFAIEGVLTIFGLSESLMRITAQSEPARISGSLFLHLCDFLSDS